MEREGAVAGGGEGENNERLAVVIDAERLGCLLSLVGLRTELFRGS